MKLLVALLFIFFFGVVFAQSDFYENPVNLANSYYGIFADGVESSVECGCVIEDKEKGCQCNSRMILPNEVAQRIVVLAIIGLLFGMVIGGLIVIRIMSRGES